MGGGNGQKSATARARKQAEAAKAAKGGSQLKHNAAAQSIICATCRQTFLCNSTAAKLKEHSDSKHPKQTFEQCFPGQTAPSAP
ncbi:hypothetical protein WJX72_002500 [[Myrmecia] bisecta]|uniref:At2g23090-like zinc-binding domain-containing protein n=1 Tax=[Myrmecia] bisecta TaxID=41462 RepID=A0AAW1QQJ9_9CHLO